MLLICLNFFFGFWLPKVSTQIYTLQQTLQYLYHLALQSLSFYVTHISESCNSTGYFHFRTPSTLHLTVSELAVFFD